MRWLLCVAVWVVVMSAALFVAAATKLGPLVVRLSQNHGVHVGDIIAVAIAVLIGLAVTAWAGSKQPREQTPG